MSKFRMAAAVLLVLSSLICAISAKPKSLTKKQQDAKDVCDGLYTVCANSCGPAVAGTNPDATIHDLCANRCIDELVGCYKKIGITAAPKPWLQGTKVPQGTLTHASPTATPSTRQPNSLTPLKKVTPTPTPTPHQSPTTTFKKKKSDDH